MADATALVHSPDHPQATGRASGCDSLRLQDLYPLTHFFIANDDLSRKRYPNKPLLVDER